ncbi:MAG: hypothetical protein HY292_18855 [Planctomycetes bacterium]|nr:hypothetical protein [Planctomycetota bacterium]
MAFDLNPRAIVNRMNREMLQAELISMSRVREAERTDHRSPDCRLDAQVAVNGEMNVAEQSGVPPLRLGCAKVNIGHFDRGCGELLSLLSHVRFP